MWVGRIQLDLRLPLPGRFRIRLQLFPKHRQTSVLILTNDSKRYEDICSLVVDRADNICVVHRCRQRGAIYEAVQLESFSTTANELLLFAEITWWSELGDSCCAGCGYCDFFKWHITEANEQANRAARERSGKRIGIESYLAPAQPRIYISL